MGGERAVSGGDLWFVSGQSCWSGPGNVWALLCSVSLMETKKCQLRQNGSDAMEEAVNDEHVVHVSFERTARPTFKLYAILYSDVQVRLFHVNEPPGLRYCIHLFHHKFSDASFYGCCNTDTGKFRCFNLS